MSSSTSIAIVGAAGRMGQRLVALGHEDPALTVVAAIDRAEHPHFNKDIGDLAGIGPIGVPLTADLRPTPGALIDFSSPASMRNWIKICRERGIAMVVGTTGLHDADHAIIDAAAADIAVLQAPNMSLGVNVLFKIAGLVAQMLGDDYDKEIVEGHHRFKKDAPSGTASGLAEAILTAMKKDKSALIYDRHGDDCVRKPGEIGMHSLRIGDEVGRHTAYFAAMGERLELTHVATSRDTFVRGALRAAKWLASKKPGRYSMMDVLGI